MTTLHVFSNRHIKDAIRNVKKGDCIFLENSLSRKRWSLYFKINNINEDKFDIHYINREEYFKLDKKINNFTIVGNPPFNDDQNAKANTGNYVSASKKLHIDFIDKALEITSEVTMVAPVRGWFVGKYKNNYLEKYKNKGLYLIENKGMPFDNAVTGEIGVFHFSSKKSFIRDEFDQEKPLANSIVDQYKMYTMVGRTSAGELDNGSLLNTGKYKVILTSNNIKYTNNNNLFNDPSRGSWRVAFNHNGNKKGKSIYGGKMQVVAPEDYLSMSMSCFVVSSREEAQNVCDYLMSDEITDLMRKIKVSNTNTKYHMSFVPPYVKN
jgi:hypothetical protein